MVYIDNKKRVLKIAIMYMVIFMIFITSGLSNVASAATIVNTGDRGTAYGQYLGNGYGGTTYYNPHQGGQQLEFAILHKKSGTKIFGYCFEPGKYFYANYTYTAKSPSSVTRYANLSDSRKQILALALYYGYNNGKGALGTGSDKYGNQNDYWAATQTLVWEIVDKDLTYSDGKWKHSSNTHYNLIKNSSYAKNCYEWIKDKIENHLKGPSFSAKTKANAKTYTLKYNYTTGKWSTTLTDTRKVNTYTKTSDSSSGLTMSRNGYTYTFSTTSAGTKTAVLMNKDANGTSQPLKVFKPSSSSYQAMIFGSTDPVRFYAKFKTEAKGTANIIKTNEDGSSSAGFQFRLTNTTNGYDKVHTTDSDGKISVDLYPGTYTATEILTDAQKEKGYTAKTVTIKVTEGETATIKVENNLPQIPVNIIKTSDNDVVAGFKFKITNSQGKTVYTGKTTQGSNNQGIISTKLYPGTYTVTEVLTDAQILEGYAAENPKKITVTKKDTLVKVKFKNSYTKPTEQSLTIRKTTTDNGSVSGFSFSISGKTEEGKTVSMSDCKTDSKGRFETELDPGTYTVTENLTEEQKLRYEEPESQTVTLTENDSGTVIFKNVAKETPIEIIKESLDGQIANIEFTITGDTTWGESIEDIVIVTDEEGKCDTTLPPGTYTVTETGLDETKYAAIDPQKIIVTGDETDPIALTFINKPNTIAFKKYETLEDGTKTTSPVEGATYEVTKKVTEDGITTEYYIGEYTTDSNGEFTVYGVSSGEYTFNETGTPNGYIVKEEPFTVEVGDGDSEVEYTDYNQRDYGTIKIEKVDPEGYAVEGAVFNLYKDEDLTEEVGSYTTDQQGRIIIEELVWGKYYLVETEAPKGYEKSDAVHKVIIGNKGTIEQEFTLVNEQKTGNVLLTKTDDTGQNVLADAEFSLYTVDGEVVKSGLVTDENGEILVEGLSWGEYYFLETKAPDGYSLLTEAKPFSVSVTTAGKTQKISIENTPKASTVVITKRLDLTHLHYDHGIPEFTFVLKGTDINGDTKEYRREAVFSESYVEENSENGYCDLTIAFPQLTAGEYTCYELDTTRYELEEITEVTSNGVVNEDGTEVTFTLVGEEVGSATFVNEKKSDESGLTDSGSVKNLFLADKQLTAIDVTYLGDDPLEGNLPFDRETLEVVAIYDDGSEEGVSDYILLDAAGDLFTRTEKVRGTYVITVQYTEGGVTCQDDFSFDVEAAKKVTVTFDTNGGTALDPLEVWKYDSLNMYSSSKYTPTKAGYNFMGWYKDAELTEAFTEADLVTESMTLYADWDEKCIGDMTWDEIKTISDSGEAEEFFSECFATVQADLADDGTLSSSSYGCTKSFTYDGVVCHAMIAGFDHDPKADGTKAGMSFIVYEQVGNAKMGTISEYPASPWKDSTMRNTTLANVYEELPDDMKAVITAVNKESTYIGTSASSITTTSDKLWLPSVSELYGDNVWGVYRYSSAFKSNASLYDSTEYGTVRNIVGYSSGVVSEGTQYALYEGLIPDGAASAESSLARGYSYWIRSVGYDIDVAINGWCFVDANGGVNFE